MDLGKSTYIIQYQNRYAEVARPEGALRAAGHREAVPGRGAAARPTTRPARAPLLQLRVLRRRPPGAVRAEHARDPAQPVRARLPPAQVRQRERAVPALHGLPGQLEEVCRERRGAAAGLLPHRRAQPPPHRPPLPPPAQGAPQVDQPEGAPGGESQPRGRSHYRAHHGAGERRPAPRPHQTHQRALHHQERQVRQQRQVQRRSHLPVLPRGDQRPRPPPPLPTPPPPHLHLQPHQQDQQHPPGRRADPGVRGGGGLPALRIGGTLSLRAGAVPLRAQVHVQRGRVHVQGGEGEGEQGEREGGGGVSARFAGEEPGEPGPVHAGAEHPEGARPADRQPLSQAQPRPRR